MKTQHLISLAAVTLLLSACVPSVNPFYTEKDLISDERLVGAWQPTDPSEKDTWKFEKDGDRGFTLTLSDKENKKGVFSAHLFQLKGKHFLDLTPKDCGFAAEQADLVSASMIRGHLLMRVSQLAPTLKLAFYNVDWLDKYLKDNPKALEHRRDNDQLVLTANTAELQRFILKHVDGGELFKEFGELGRITEPAAAKK